MADACVALSHALIARASVTPEDAGCQALIAERLAALGFRVDHLRFGEVDNLLLEFGAGGRCLMLLGHTDVVPPGPLTAWHSDPFTPTPRDGRLYGRGAADMKGAVAAMVVALEQFAREWAGQPGRVQLLLTSDEEGAAQDGVRRVASWLVEQGRVPDYCVVGEPSSIAQLGDLIRVGRRGSLHGRLLVRGVQGHVAYPDQALNPIHAAAPALAALTAEVWDQGLAEFPPTSFQLSNLHAGTGADNVIPGQLEAQFNFRFAPTSSPQSLRQRVEALLVQHGVDFEIEWRLSGEPFLTQPGRLRDAVVQAVQEVCAITPRADTGGGTSDGRFIAPLGVEVVELGPINASIHKIDEHIELSDLRRLPQLYLGIARRLLG